MTTCKYSVGERVYYVGYKPRGSRFITEKIYGIIERIEPNITIKGVRNKIWARWGDSTSLRWMSENEVFQDSNDKVIPYDPNQIGDTDDDL